MNQNTPISKWLKFSILNLLIVAGLGVLMRYKIAFEFPFFDQKNIQHAHSHFAFAGWLSHTLYTFILISLKKPENDAIIKKVLWLIPLNLLSAYGMLISFFIQGYGMISIVFSTMTILISFLFAFHFFKAKSAIESNDQSRKWIKAALIFNVISSIGTYFLACMMISKNLDQTRYLGSVYFYLHFQYNGWFTMACIGLFINYLNDLQIDIKDKLAYYFLVISCLPAYFLSTLWYHLPIWVYVITVIAAIIQFIGWVLLVKGFWREQVLIKAKLNRIAFQLFILSALALSVKFLLQLGSTVPEISQLAFGFRPIVIAYLHLVLLGVITIYLLAHLLANHFIVLSRSVRLGIYVFIIGILMNESLLMVQGIASFSYTLIPFVNEALLVIALIMFGGLAIIGVQSFKKVTKASNSPV